MKMITKITIQLVNMATIRNDAGAIRIQSSFAILLLNISKELKDVE